MHTRPGALALFGSLAALLGLAGCATSPSRIPVPDAPSGQVSVLPIGDRIATGALAQLGRPYRYGGAGPDAFDCSGLVAFVHAGLGIPTPRTTADQYRAARIVPASQLQPGDLLFFRIASQAVAHVGIYVGDGHFVHAPQTGRPVERRAVDDAYFRPRLLGSGRLY